LHLEFNLMSRGEDREWIDERLAQIHQYRELQGCVEGARAILNVVDYYELKGDFHPIKLITNVVRKLITE